MTGWRTASPMSAKARIAGSLASAASRGRPRMLALRKTFSTPLYSGLKPEPSSSRAATRPLVRSSPALGVSVPQTSCSSVDFPDPLRPMMPTVSPRRTSRSRGARASKTPW